MMTSKGNTRRGGLLAAGAGLIGLAAVPLPVGPAAAQQRCEQLAGRAEQEMRAAELTDTQREYIADLIGTARTFLERNDERACMENLADLAEFVDQERIALPVAAEIDENRASAVGDTQEAGAGAEGGIQRPEQGQQPTAAPASPLAGAAEAGAPRVLPGPGAAQTQPGGVTVEQAEPEITVEQAEPNVIIE